MSSADTAIALIADASCVDALSQFTAEMWDILTDVVLQEWFGIRLPASKVPWTGPLHLPGCRRLLYCLDRKHAQQLKSEVERHYFSLNRDGDSMSIFAGYGLDLDDDLKREHEGLSFLARQAEHFRSYNDYLFIIQTE